MSKRSSYRKCLECGIFTANADHCKNCGALISYEKKVAIRIEKEKQERIAKEKWQLENPSFVIRLKQHPFFLYKIAGWILYSAFVVVSAIGAALAWFLAMVAAG